ncbi:MAG: hypothetical protein E6I75_04850 [Chloroflexi bacterium]|nr:MAG: hypothetical protein E6I75_04850 [Chloroflexota bacterium]
MQRLNILFAALLALSVITSACGSSGSGAPTTAGQYSVQKDSVHFDGDRYQLYWADSSGALHHMDTHNLRLVRDPDRTYLDVPQSGDPVLHLREDEPVTVEGRDQQGAFSSPWFPFLLGATLGNTFGGGRGGQTIVINNPAPGERGTYDRGTPAYRYPPTGTFGRDDELHGSLDTSKAQPPDYSRVQPAPYATAGKSSGTGGGAAASNKSVGVTSATSGQSGGTGGGAAASSKGGFANGSQSYANREPSGSSGVGAGSRGVLGGSGSSGATPSKPSTGISGGKGIGGARAPSVGRH